jgi:hypothetical protein
LNQRYKKAVEDFGVKGDFGGKIFFGGKVVGKIRGKSDF